MAGPSSYQRLNTHDTDSHNELTNDDPHKLTPSPYSDDDDKLRIIDAYSAPARRPSLRTPRIPKCCIAASVLIIGIAITIILSGGFVFYTANIINGQSPPWYPSPPGGTVSSWQESYNKAQKMVERMTLPEKVNLTTGTGWAMDLCVGNTAPAMLVGFPALCLQDGPLGIRFADHATSFPAGITVGSTWNRDLMRRRGAAHGREARLKGVNVLLGPSMGALGRNPAGGRTWEGFGADPVLQAVAAYETIMGIQSQGVMATAKHFVGNEQEHFRKSFEWGLPEALSSNIDDRTMHEIYTWPFAESIRAGVASVMCSYQMVNNSYACQNSKLLNGILKDELGFQGFVQSDWLAQRSGVASALAGLDMSMPGDGSHWQNGKALFGNQLSIAVLNGSVPIERLNDMAVRIVAAWYQLGQEDWQGEPNFSSWTNDKIGKWHDAASNSHDKGVVNKFVEAPNDESRNVARQVAAEGTVLLKNEGILPLDSKLSAFSDEPHVMIVGEDAGPGQGPNVCADRACNQGTLAVGWGSGSSEFMYLVDPLSALRKTFDSSVKITAHLSNKIDSKVITQLKQQDLCLVFANADGGEGYLSWKGVRGDRPDLELQKDGSQLIRTVAENCGGPTVAIVHAVGPVILEEFVGLSSVKAIVFANLPGQESGNALADVLFGKVDASGRLAFTIGKSLASYGEGAQILYYPNHMIPQVDFSEGLYIDYRYFDKHDIEPRYPFGYGLSYTSFEMSGLNITALKAKSALPDERLPQLSPPRFSKAIPDVETALFPVNFFKLKKYLYPYISSKNEVRTGQYPYPDGYDIERIPSQAGGGEGGNPSLFESHVQVSFELRNTGPRSGKEVIQLYLSMPDIVEGGDTIDTPVKVLRNFEKVQLEAGESKMVKMDLTRKDLSYWSVKKQNWIMPTDGKFTIAVGRNYRDIVLSGEY